MNVYEAGGMRGRDPKVVELLFRQGASKLRRQGHTVFSPFEHDLDAGFSYEGNEPVTADQSFLRQALAADTKWICESADAVALLPGWERSKGATAEKALAEALGIEVWLPEQWFYAEPSVDGKDMMEHLRLRNQEWDRAKREYVDG